LDNAVREDWLKAVAEMRAIMGVVDRSFSFKERPYDYLLEACASSNTIAAFYNLSRGQQIELILGSIPVLSHVYKQIKMFRTLEDIFELANMSSTTLFTKLELESLIESWHINLESFSTINESIGKLKCLITDAAEMELAPHMLYGEILKRLKREKLPGHVMRSLDEMTIRIGSETNMLVMHEYLLAALKPALGWKGRVTVSGGSGAIYKLEDAEPGSSYGPHSSSSVQSLPAALTDNQMMAWQNLVHQLTDASQNPTNSNTNKNTSAKKKTERGRSKNKKSTGTGNKNKNSNTGNQRSKSRGGRLECVPPWPKNKKYLSRNGNQLTDELLRHFSGYCFRCGLNNHRATTCKFYDKAVILSLCTVCDRGFHEVCKNPRYAKTNANANQQKTNDSKGPVVTTPTEVKKLEEKMMKMLEERPNYPMWYPFPPPAMLMHKPVMPGVDSDDE
jgi:hypothetical protein